MANFTLQLTVGVAKGAAAQWFYVQNSVGHSYGNPVDVQIGDTVTFTRATSSAGTAKVRLLNIFTNNADIDLTSSAPTVVRTIATGGTTLDSISGRNQGETVTDDFFLERQAAPSITAPTASSVTFNNPASTNTTATVNLSASGSGGTLEYACEVGDSTPDNWQSSSTFTITRGTGTVYARARRSSTTNSNVVSATRPAFLIGDTGVNPSSTTIAYSDTSETTTVAFGTAGETYAVRLNNGSTNLGIALAPAGSPSTISISFSTSLPTAGNTTTYEVFVRRPTSTGGDGITYHPTNDTFTVTRTAADVTPSGFDFTNQTGVALSSTRTSANTITIGGMDTGVTASVTISGGQYSKNLAGYSSQSGITATNGDTFKVRHTSSGSFSTSTTTTLTVGGVSGSFVSTTTADNIAPVITRTGSSIWNLTVGGSYSDQGATAADNLDGNITSSIVTVNPVNTAVVGTYTVTYNVSDAAGNAAPQVTRTVYVNPAPPVVNNTQNFAATESSSTSCNVSLTSSGTGGTLEYNKSTSQVIPTGVWYSTPTVTGLTRGTSYYFWARTANGSAYTDRTNASILVPYLPPKSFNYATTTNIPYVDTSHTLTITNGDPDHTYGWGIGVVGKGTAAYTNSSTITISSNSALPTAGASLNYEVLVKRGTTSGGSNSYVSITTTLPVNRYPQTPTASVGFNNPNDNDVTATVTASNTTGSNSLAYSNGGTYVAGNTFGAVRGTAANYYVRSTGANGLTATSTAAAATPGYNAPDAAITAIASPNLAYGSTTHVVTIAGGNALDQYYVYNNAGSVSYGGRTGNGTITITHGVAAGGAATFRVYARRPVAVGGDNAFDDTGTTFEVEVYPNSPVLSVSNDNPSSASVTATLSATGGQGGTIEYAKTSYSSTTTYAQDRGTSVTYYARSVGSNGLISSVSTVSHAVGYITPGLTVYMNNVSIAHNDSSASVSIGSTVAGQVYAVRTVNGSTTLGSTTATSTTTVVSWTSSLPAQGNSTTYEIYVQRPTSIGGNNAWYDTNDQFTVTRSVAPDTTPDAFTFTDVTNVALSSTQTSNIITVAGLNTSTSVSISGGTYSKNGGAYTSANTTAVNGNTFAVRHTASGSFSTAASCTLNIGGVTDAYSSTTLAADTTPNAFAFTDKTGNVDTEQNSSALITGINTNSTVSRTSGTATFAVSSSASTPAASNFSSSAKTVNTSIDYVHVKQNASTSYSTTLSSSFAIGGVSDTWYVTSNAPAADGTPDQFSFTDVTTALSTVSYSYAQITGISTSITASRSSGAATFAVSSSTSVPSSGSFNTSNKTITNNQYLHVKQTSSSSNSTTLSSVFAAGGVSATWNLSTVGSSGSGAGYGLQVFPTSGTIPRLDTTDRTVRVLGVHTGTLAAGGSSATVTQAGFSSSSATIGVEWQTSGDPQYASLSSSGTSLTIARSSNDPSSLSNTYQLRIFRI